MTANYPFPVPVGEFKDKRVLVTGGTKGIGEAIVRRFHDERCARCDYSTLSAAARSKPSCLCAGGHRHCRWRASCNRSD